MTGSFRWPCKSSRAANSTIASAAKPPSALTAQIRHLCTVNDSSMGTVTHETTVCTRAMQLLERDQYLEDLTRWLGAAAGGAGSIALICGEAGIGKTSLLQQFSQQQR